MGKLTVIFFCSFKFAMTFPVALYCFHLNFWETVFYTNIGGILGVLFFSFFSDLLIRLFRRCLPASVHREQHPRPRFSPKTRRYVKIKNRYGLPGIVLLNPVVLSIPVGAFLVTRFYGPTFRNLLFLVAGQVAWSFVYAGFYMRMSELALRMIS